MLQEKEAEAINTDELLSIKFNLMIIADFLQNKIVKSLKK